MAQKSAVDWICKYCQSWSAPLRCSQCKFTPYCNAECQKKDWKNHRQVCKKPDAARVDYDTIMQKTVDAVAPLLGLNTATTRVTDLGNAYLQILVRIACIRNGITTVDDSTKIMAVEFRFDYRSRADPTGTSHTVLQLTAARSYAHEHTPFIFSPDAVAHRNDVDARLHASTGVYDDPTCCHIPMLFGSQKSQDVMDPASVLDLAWVSVLPGVARKAVQGMKESGMNEVQYTGMLIHKFNDMIVHEKVRDAAGHVESLSFKIG